MSRGMKGAIASLALLGLSVFLGASPAVAQSVAGTDNLAPRPVANVQASFDEGGISITVSWEKSRDDVIRQVPTSSDFTTGGTFKNVNDVAGYTIWRRLADDLEGWEEVGEVRAGGTSFVDDITDEILEAGGSERYFYMVSVFDASPSRNEIKDPGELTPSDEVKNMWVTGDFDYDGDVDLDDYEIIADMDDDGDVDLDDFFRWADHLGEDLYREYR